MVDYQLNDSIFLIVEYCRFRKIENENNITKCSFGSKFSKELHFKKRKRIENAGKIC